MLIDITNQKTYHPKLRELLLWLEEELGVHFVNTSGFRPGDRGVHGYGRGFDLRIRNELFGSWLADFINVRWQYNYKNPTKQVAVAHGEGAEYHLHLQVHDNTQPK